MVIVQLWKEPNEVCCEVVVVLFEFSVLDTAMETGAGEKLGEEGSWFGASSTTNVVDWLSSSWTLCTSATVTIVVDASLGPVGSSLAKRVAFRASARLISLCCCAFSSPQASNDLKFRCPETCITARSSNPASLRVFTQNLLVKEKRANLYHATLMTKAMVCNLPFKSGLFRHSWHHVSKFVDPYRIPWEPACFLLMPLDDGVEVEGALIL